MEKRHTIRVNPSLFWKFVWSYILFKNTLALQKYFFAVCVKIGGIFNINIYIYGYRWLICKKRTSILFFVEYEKRKMGRFFFFYSFLCLVLLISRCFSSSFDNHLCSPTEASVFLQFKKSYKIFDYSSFQCDISYQKTKPWNEIRDCRTWDGVTCDMLTGHVIDMELSCSKLFGTFQPNSSLFRLHHL